MAYARVRWEPEQIDAFKTLVDRGLTRDEIAAHLGLNWRKVALVAHEYGFRITKRKRAPITFVWKGERLEALRRLASEGKAAKEIAESLGVDHATIRSAAYYAGIEIRRVNRSWQGETLEAVLRRVRAGETVAAVAADLGCHPGTLQSVLQQRKLVALTFAERRARLAAHNHAIERRTAIELHREELRELQRRAARLPPLFGDVDRYLHAVTPENREDVRQDAILAVLEGATLDRALIEKLRSRYAPRKHDVSLDEPIGDERGRRYHEIIADPRTFDPSD